MSGPRTKARPRSRPPVAAPAPRRVGKSAAAFRTISEVADGLDVPQHVLRFWETRFPQVRPLKRGGGRRYYRPEDVDLLRRIRHLLYDAGYTIKGVQRLLKEGTLVEAGEVSGNEPAARPPRSHAAPREPQMALELPGGLDARKRAEIEAILRELLVLRDRLRALAR